MRRTMLFGILAGLTQAMAVHAAVVINEFQYNDGGTDDAEFVELFNNGESAVDISGWTLGGHDNASNPVNPMTTLPGNVGSGTTIIPAGGYFVIGNESVPNVNHVVAPNFLENSSESIELYDGPFDASALQDGLVYEGFRGPTSGGSSSYGPLSPAMTTEVGGATIYGITTPGDGTPGTARLSIGRYVDGRDTNNNGRDFGLRPFTPGAANSPTTMTAYVAPNADDFADGDFVSGHIGTFVGLRVITPDVVPADATTPFPRPYNPNAIPPAPGHAKALIAWDPTGGGNAVASEAVFAGGPQKYDITAYLDTNDLPVSTNGSGVSFQSSEFTYYGLAGSIDGNVNGFPNVSGSVATISDSSVGATGVMWYYEKVGGEGATPLSEKLFLVDAGDGGNENTAPGNATPDEWTVLQTIDLSGVASDWHRLSIEIDAAGNGLARYDDQTFNFTTAPNLYGSFYVGYRENTQDGTNGVPSFVRPPTFVQTSSGSTEDADFNNDGRVDGADFLLWQRNQGGAGDNGDGDANGDGQVNAADLTVWQGAFGMSGGPAVGVPEPGAMLIGAVGFLAAAMVRRRSGHGG